MAKCPKCKTEVAKSTKNWKYGYFMVYVYECKCGTIFREYMRNGKNSFTLVKKGYKFVRPEEI